MNAVKKQIQKEEYLALAINKYIVQNAKLPITSENKFDWSVLLKKEYLGESFNKTNTITNKAMHVVFDENKNIFIKGALVQQNNYDSNNSYLYNFYTNRVFRVNTIAPKDTSKLELLKGSQVLYPKLQKNIVDLIKDNKILRLDSEACPSSNYFYELRDRKLTYKYCKGLSSIEIFQDSPVFLEDIDDLAFVKGKLIGDKAFVQKNGR